MTTRYRILAVLLAGGLAACAGNPPGPRLQGAAQGVLSTAPYEQAKPVPLRARLYTISPGLIAALRVEKPAAGDPGRLDVERRAYQYRLGAGDELRLSVWSPLRTLASFNAETPAPAQPEAAAATPAAIEPIRSRVIAGMKPVAALTDLVLQVQPDGQVQIPYVGSLKVAGQTRAQLAQLLEKQLTSFIPFPVLDLRVTAYRAQVVQVTGEVAHPGAVALDDQPLTLLDVLGRAGPMSANADPSRVVLFRAGKRHVIALPQLLQGDPLYNGVLQAGDIVNVPDGQDAKVFVLGEVSLRQRSVLQLRASGMSLGEALASAGGINPLTANTRGVFVMRASREERTVVQVFQLNLDNASAYVLADAFPLRARDFVFVSPSRDADWSRVAQELMPLMKAPDPAEAEAGPFKP